MTDRIDTLHKRLFIHSLLAYTIAFLASTLSHEGAHALTALSLGDRPVMHHNYVTTHPSDGRATAGLWVPLSGPLASLVTGVVCLLAVRRTRKPSVLSLTLLWLMLNGFIAFFGYLMMGPLFAYGDTGKVYAALGLPTAVAWLLALLGLFALVTLLRSAAVDFERHVPSALSAGERSRAGLANVMIAGPIFAGVLVTTLLSLPVPNLLSLLHPVMSPFAIFAAYGAFRRRDTPWSEGGLYPDGVSIPLLVTAAALTAISRALVGGVTLGA